MSRASGRVFGLVRQTLCLRDAYVSGKINEKLKVVYDEVNRTFDEFVKNKIVIYG